MLKDENEAYERLADALNALPNGFPRTESGVELRLLRRLVGPEEARFAAQLGRRAETAEEIAGRLGLGLEEVMTQLRAARQCRLVRTEGRGPERRYRLAPFLVGLWEEQVGKLDHETAHLFEQYMMVAGAKGILGQDPPIHRVLPARRAVKTDTILPYEDVRALLLQARSFFVRDCICREEQDALGSRKCDFPRRNCLVFSREEGVFGQYGISRQEALNILDEAEELGLVHAVSNSIEDVSYVCNCCGCCCGVLRGITRWGVANSVARTSYYAETDTAVCTGCGTCTERCQVGAVTVVDGLAVVDRARCIGCGLCVTGCPSEAMHLHRLPEADIQPPPVSFAAWEEARLRNRAGTA